MFCTETIGQSDNKEGRTRKKKTHNKNRVFLLLLFLVLKKKFSSGIVLEHDNDIFSTTISMREPTGRVEFECSEGGWFE